jgi:intracellular sulfur oxidation DsrE/DsrF family protein
MMSTKHFIKSSLFILLLIGLSAPAWSGDRVTTGDRVVFHLDDTSNARWAMLLANSYLDDSPNAKVVIVAYGPGIDFLLLDAQDKRGQPYDPAVLNLVEKGVEFRVCAETLSARQIAKEDVLDTAAIVPSGITEIVRLQSQEGYAYLKP